MLVPLMSGNLFDALKSVGVEEGLAKKAAQEVLNHHGKSKTYQGELLLLKWLLLFNLGLTGAILFSLL